MDPNDYSISSTSRMMYIDECSTMCYVIRSSVIQLRMHHTSHSRLVPDVELYHLMENWSRCPVWCREEGNPEKGVWHPNSRMRSPPKNSYNSPSRRTTRVMIWSCSRFKPGSSRISSSNYKRMNKNPSHATNKTSLIWSCCVTKSKRITRGRYYCVSRSSIYIYPYIHHRKSQERKT